MTTMTDASATSENSAAAAWPTTTAAVETWKPACISFPYGVVGTSVHGTDLIGAFNMMDYIGKDCRKRNTIRLERRPEWNNCDDPRARAVLIRVIVQACAAAGMAIRCKGWERDRMVMVFLCQRGSIYRKKVCVACPSKQRQTSSVKPTKVDELCRFRFQITWSEEYSCWTLRGGAGHGEHCGHGSSIVPNSTTDQDQETAFVTTANDVAWQQAQDRWVQQCCFTDYLPLWQEMATLANANFTVYQAVIKGMYELRDAMRVASTEANLAAAKSLATSTTVVGRTTKRVGTSLETPATKKKDASITATSTSRSR
jgi:hypothetical protein